MGWVVNTRLQSFYAQERDPVQIVQEDGWATGAFWTGAENLFSTGIQTPNRPTRSDSKVYG
jgi:hypothetical protein